MSSVRALARKQRRLILLATVGVLAFGSAPAVANHGRLDITFGSSIGTSGIRTGKVLTPIGDDAEVTGLVIQPDGKIVAGGTATTGGARVAALARYNANGTLDTTFDGDGIALGGSAPNGASVTITDIARQPDGKLVVVGGSTFANGRIAWFLERFHPNGAVDTSFGSNGSVTLDVGGSTLTRVNAIAPIQSDGRLLIAGNTADTFGGAVARLTPGGQFDTSFGSSGMVTIPPSGYVQDIARQSDGKLVIGSTVYDAVRSRLAVTRLSASGQLDTSFSGDGLARAGIVGNVRAYGAAVQVRPTGRIDIGGWVEFPSEASPKTDRFVLIRFNTDGTLSATIPPDGGVTTTFPDAAPGALGNDMVLSADGREVIGGVALDRGVFERFAMARYNADGTLDREFGGSGGGALDGAGRVVTPPFTATNSSRGIAGPGEGGIQALALQSNGFIVAGGRAVKADGRFMFAVARYHGVENADPRAKLRIPRQSLEGVLKSRRLRVTVTTNEPGRVRATVRRGKQTVAGGRANVEERLRRTFTLRLSRAARRRLAGQDSARITVRVTFSDAGGKRVRVRKKARLR